MNDLVTAPQLGLSGTDDGVTADSGAARIGTRAWAALAVLCLGAFLVVLDTTIVNIAVPSIIAGLQSGLDQVLWVLNGYMLVYAALLITGGRLGDFYGRRWLLVLGIVIFVAASLACAVSQSVAELIAARVVQGVGGALLTPQTLALIPVIFPEQRRGTAIGIWSGSAGLAAAIGPSVGGFLVTNVGWRSIFLVNVPVGVLALVGAIWLLPRHNAGRKHRLDLGGIGLASAGLFAIVFGVVEGERYGWGAVTGPVTIPAILVTGVALLVAFVVWEARQPEPLMPLALFANRNFAISASVIAVFQLVMLTFIVVAALYFQSALHMTPLAAGLALVPMPLTVMLVGPLAGRLADRVDPKFVLIAGLLIAAGGLACVAVVASPTATGSRFILPLVITGGGLGAGFALVMTMGMQGAGRLAGAASGVLNTCRQVGGTMGAAIAVAVLQNRLAATLPHGSEGVSAAAYAGDFVGALRWTLAAPIALLVIAAASCIWITNRSDGPATRPAAQPVAPEA